MTTLSSQPRSPSLRLIYAKAVSVEISLLIDTETPLHVLLSPSGCVMVVAVGVPMRPSRVSGVAYAMVLVSAVTVAAPRVPTAVLLKPIGRRSLSQGRVPLFPGSCLRSGGGGCHCHGQQTHHSLDETVR